MKTRSRRAPPKKTASQEGAAATTITKALEPSTTNPPFLCVLPKDHSQSARIITHPNPATSNPCRYFVCPEKGFYEFTRIAAPKKQCRSVLLAPDRKRKREEPDHGVESKEDTGYVLQDANIMLATPVDPLFLLLPVLAPSDEARAENLFESFSDHLDRLSSISRHLQHFLRGLATESTLSRSLEGRMAAVCDSVDAGSEKMYRLSTSKLLQEIAKKAKRMCDKGLPASMEDRFVQQPLDVPALSVKREESFSEDAGAGAESLPTPEDSQDSTASQETTAAVVTAVVSKQPAAPPDIVDLLRILTALTFMLTSYVPPNLRNQLTALLSSTTSPLDFTPLDKHLEHLAGLKRKAHALRSLSDNISRKRGIEADEDAMEKAETKKRKKEEEELKKKNMSRGVQQLKKIDTSGMKKLSSFFGKAAMKKGGS